MSDFISHLNTAQQQAVQHTDGPVLIIAGAGSGKTRALTYRIAYLIHEKKVSPESILAVTFTNKAAQEMKSRIQSITGESFDEHSFSYGFPSRMPLVGTFHSICVRILRHEIEHLKRDRNFVIFDTTDTLGLMRQICKDLQIDEKQFNPKNVLQHISNAKNELVSPSMYADFADNYFKKNVAELYNEYQKRLHKSNALDFDDILMHVIEIFQQHPKVLEKYQKKWQYVSVDEYQDTNFVQYTLVNMLAKNHRNLCVIGDSDQSIYSFRGADIRNILNFEKDYPNAEVIKLEQNYRSTQNILDAADAVIDKNQNRPKKKMWTERGEGEKVKVMLADSEREEGDLIIKEMGRVLASQGTYTDYSQFVILYRTNAQSRMLEESLIKNAIPYKVIGGVKFYSRKEIKDILAYIRFIVLPQDTVSLLRIINVPPRKIGAKTISVLSNYAAEHAGSIFDVIQNIEDYKLSKGATAALKEFRKTIKDIKDDGKTMNVSDFIRFLIDRSGYKEYLTADGSEEGKVRYENVLELISVARKYNDMDLNEGLHLLLEEVALISDIDSFEEKDNAVTLMTLHTAKGLEFPYVFIAGCEENVFPHAKSVFEEEQLEEERRLMYVGMTRAENQLFLLAAKRRLLFGDFQRNPLSRFIDDIPDELTDGNHMAFSPFSRPTSDFDEEDKGFNDFDFNQDIPF